MNIYLQSISDELPKLDLLDGKSRFNEMSTVELIDKFLVDELSLADAILISHDAIHFGNNSKYMDQLREYAKTRPVILFDCGDIPQEITIENVYSFRNSYRPYSKKYNNLTIPYNVKPIKNMIFRSYSKNPVASFVGYIPKLISRRLIPRSFSHFWHPVKHNGALIRFFTHRNLVRLNDFIFVKRNHYGGAKSLIINIEEFQREYIESFEKSDFVLCPRGDANQSARYFETLSAGRIPVIPNSGIIFPKLPQGINGPENIIIRSASSNLKSTLNKFWNKLDSERYYAIQKRNKEIFDNYWNYRSYMTWIFGLSFNEFKNLCESE